MLDKRTLAIAHLRFLASRGYPEPKRILDFGCGTGGIVRELLSLGYDAYGVDVHDAWSAGPHADLGNRLHVLDLADYRLPFEDRSFDLVLSDEVFEHVKDYPTAFREILRVLKPGHVSAHRFPGPLTLIEGHTRIPISAFCHATGYLKLWAWLGIRTPDQRALRLGWRDTLASNLGIMDSVVYPTKYAIRTVAAQTGGRVEFVAREELLHRNFGRAGQVVAAAKSLRLGSLAASVLAPFGQRYMLLSHAEAHGPGAGQPPRADAPH